MIRATALAALLLAGCDRAPPARDDSPGGRLERAATEAGLVTDPATATLVGSYARDTDRVCVVPAERGTFRLGAVIDYGEGQGCAGSGTARRVGARVAVSFGPCRFDAHFDGDRLIFPAELPAACDATCTGRASFAAMTVDHVSPSVSEARTLRGPAGQPMCAD